MLFRLGSRSSVLDPRALGFLIIGGLLKNFVFLIVSLETLFIFPLIVFF